MECVEPRTVHGGRLILDEPFSSRLERVDHDGAAIAHSKLKDRPIIFLRPCFRCSRVVFAKLIKVASKELASWDFRNAIDLADVDVEETQVNRYGSERYNEYSCANNRIWQTREVLPDIRDYRHVVKFGVLYCSLLTCQRIKRSLTAIIFPH